MVLLPKFSAVSSEHKITASTVRDAFNDPVAVMHYARAAHFLGLWESERLLIARFFPDKTAPLLEAGCGAGRVSVALHDQGYTALTAFDFAGDLLEQARFLAKERGADPIRFLLADATKLNEAGLGSSFAGALFMFNGLMQIPGRENRRTALRRLSEVCRPDAPLLFTTHDRNISPLEITLWRLEACRWEAGTQDPRLVDFGDRYFEDETGRTFMHLPDRTEIIEDLSATGWSHTFDALRCEIARENRAVRDFSDECRFWSAVNRR